MTARCAIYVGAREIFESPWLRPRLIFLKFLMSFCSDRSYECAYKIWSSYSFTRSVIGVPPKSDSPWIRPCFFPANFNKLLFRMDAVNVPFEFESVALPVPEIKGGSQKTSGRRRSGMVPYERGLASSYRLCIVTFPLHAFQRYCSFCAPAWHFSPPHL